MALPPNAIIFTDVNGVEVEHDPYDRVEYTLNLEGASGGILEDGEGIASWSVALTAEAAALGLTIGTLDWAPMQPSPLQVRFWIEVDSGFQANAAFDGEGTRLGVEVNVTTNNVPARRRQRTAAIKVAQQ